MYTHDMQQRRKRGLAKVMAAIEAHGGTTLLSTGITGDDGRMAMAAVEAGALLLEPNHPSVCLARGIHAVKTLNEAEKIRHELPMELMVEVTAGIRRVVGPDVFLTCGFPGGFTETEPTPVYEEDLIALAQAGMDGVHCHKSSLEDLQEMTEMAHRCGLLVDAYISVPDDPLNLGIPAATPADVAAVARDMEQMGVDMIGIMSGMTYVGAKAGQMAPDVAERIKVLIDTVSVPTLAEGGINLTNFKAFKQSGVNIIVVGTSFDDLAKEAVAGAVKTYLE